MADRPVLYVLPVLAGLLGMSQAGTQIALALSILVLALSAVLYQIYLFRKGDVE